MNVGDVVLINYNIKEPKTRGLWYDFLIEKLNDVISGTVMAGNINFENCIVFFTDEIMRIETPDVIENRKHDKNVSVKSMSFTSVYIGDYYSINVLGKTVYTCNTCNDIPTKKCNKCGCKVCFGKENITSIILCDDCDNGYHITCLNPPLSSIPSESDWFVYVIETLNII